MKYNYLPQHASIMPCRLRDVQCLITAALRVWQTISGGLLVGSFTHCRWDGASVDSIFRGTPASSKLLPTGFFPIVLHLFSLLKVVLLGKVRSA